jgi:uncharacterized membrane protein
MEKKSLKTFHLIFIYHISYNLNTFIIPNIECINYQLYRYNIKNSLICRCIYIYNTCFHALMRITYVHENNHIYEADDIFLSGFIITHPYSGKS